MQRAVMEMVRFSLVAGADERALVEQSQPLERWLATRDGFVKRTLLGPDDDGRYTDLVYWSSREAAQQAAEQFMSEPSLDGLRGLIAPEQIEMRHVPIVSG